MPGIIQQAEHEVTISYSELTRNTCEHARLTLINAVDDVPKCMGEEWCSKHPHEYAMMLSAYMACANSADQGAMRRISAQGLRDGLERIAEALQAIADARASS